MDIEISKKITFHSSLIENIKKALNKIISEGFYPTIFFIRFDRISEAATAEFIANLEGISLLTLTFKNPDLMKKQAKHLEGWLETLA